MKLDIVRIPINDEQYSRLIKFIILNSEIKYNNKILTEIMTQFLRDIYETKNIVTIVIISHNIKSDNVFDPSDLECMDMRVHETYEIIFKTKDWDEFLNIEFEPFYDYLKNNYNRILKEITNK